MSWNILEHSFTVKCFAEITSSRTPSSFPSQSLSSFLLTSCLYSVPLAACLEFSKWQPFFLWLHLCLIRILLPSLSFVTYLPHFHLLAKSSFTYLFLWITMNYHMGFSLQDRGNTAHFAVCEVNDMHRDQSQTNSERSDRIGHWCLHTSVIYVVICGLDGSAGGTFCNPSQLMCHSN